MTYISLLQQWLLKEKKNIQLGKRQYIHFDHVLSPEDAIAVITDPLQVKSHSFYPFIYNVKKNKKFNKKTNEISIKTREINTAAHMDAYIYSWYRTILSQTYEELLYQHALTDCVIAYRSIKKNGESYRNIHFANEVFNFIKNQEDCVILTYDIKKFFDTLNHQQLKKLWKSLLNVKELPADHYNIFKSLTSFSYVERNSIYKLFHIKKKIKLGAKIKRLCTPKEFRENAQKIIKRNPNIFKKKGIPQGSPISDLLSNIYMVPFDKEINDMTTEHCAFYRRYCDDIIIICDKKNEELFTTTVSKKISEIGLELHEKKTKIFYFSRITKVLREKGENIKHQALLQYLGFEFNGQKTYIRASSLSKYYQKIKSRVKRAAITASAKGNGIIFKKKLYQDNTFLGTSKGNFITYAKKAVKIITDNGINKQISPHFNKVKKEIIKRELQISQLKIRN